MPHALPAGNFEFGIGRVMRALEPLSANLDAIRWHGAKLCFLAMLDQMAKQMLVPKVGQGRSGASGCCMPCSTTGCASVARALYLQRPAHVALVLLAASSPWQLATGSCCSHAILVGRWPSVPPTPMLV
jgi:hypothetical protein